MSDGYTTLSLRRIAVGVCLILAPLGQLTANVIRPNTPVESRGMLEVIAANDTRSKAFVEQWGDAAVELDALPVGVLRDRLVREVEGHMDLEALEHTRSLEREDNVRLGRLLEE